MSKTPTTRQRKGKPRFICRLLTDDNKIIRAYCWDEEVPKSVEVLLKVENENIYTKREATTKETEELLKGNMALQRPDGEFFPAFAQPDGTLADEILILREKKYNPYKKIKK